MGWPPSYAKDIQIMFAKLCNDTAFVTLLSIWGGWHWTPPVTANGTTTPGSWAPSNFSLQFGGSGPPSAWGNWTYFGLEWISWANVPANATTHGPCRPCQWAEFWSGSLPGTNYTGPNLTIYQVIIVGGPSGPGSAGPTGLFLLLSNVWFVGLLAAVVLAVAISSLVVSRRLRLPAAHNLRERSQRALGGHSPRCRRRTTGNRTADRHPEGQRPRIIRSSRRRILERQAASRTHLSWMGMGRPVACTRTRPRAQKLAHRN